MSPDLPQSVDIYRMVTHTINGLTKIQLLIDEPNRFSTVQLKESKGLCTDSPLACVGFDGKVVQWSESAAAFTSLPMDQMMDHVFKDSVQEKDQPIVQSMLHFVKEKRQPTDDQQIQLRLPHGGACDFVLLRFCTRLTKRSGAGNQ